MKSAVCKTTFIRWFMTLTLLLIVHPFIHGQKINSPTNKAIQITSDPTHEYHAKFSPDGKMMAFISWRSGEPKIWLLTLPDGEPKLLETGLSGDHHISWSPDNSMICFDAKQKSGAPGVYTIALIEKMVNKMGSTNTPAFHPSISPNRGLLACSSLRSGNPDIWIISGDDQAEKQLTDYKGMDVHPIFSPDGSRIAFTSNRSGNMDIWVLTLSSNELKQVTFHEGKDDQACWSPEGTRLAFSSDRAGQSDIWLVTLESGDLVKFTEQSDNGWPSWSPDGKYIAFSSNRTGNKDIWIKKVND